MYNMYKKAVDFFHYIQNTYNAKIIIKDYVGFLPLNKDLDMFLQPFLSHCNNFCMYIKSDINQYAECLKMKERMYKKLQDTKAPFLGMCYAGLEEYVIPIMSNNVVIGSINISFYKSNYIKTISRIEKVCNNSSLLDYNTAKQLYDKYVTFTDLPNEFIPLFEIIAAFISSYSDIVIPVSSAANKYYTSSEDTILSDTINFLKTHYKENIKLSDISLYCHCSESYLSHTFKKRNGLSIITYLTRIRIEEAKNLLKHSNLTISEIAALCGFNDPNYFSKTFTQYVKCTPSIYKSAYSNDKK